MLDCDTLPIPWMGLCARPSASDALDAGICEELAPLPEPQLVLCTRSSSWAAPKVRSPTGTSPLQQQAHLLPHRLPPQPILPQRCHTPHPQARPPSRLAPHKSSQAHDSTVWAPTWSDIPLTRTSLRLCLKRPHDPLLGTRKSRRRWLCLCVRMPSRPRRAGR